MCIYVDYISYINYTNYIKSDILNYLAIKITK